MSLSLRDLDEVLATCVAEQEEALPHVPTVVEQINSTGLHPIADGRTHRARHALPWRSGHVYLDACDALDGVQSTARHADRSFMTSMGLLAVEVEQACWTLGAVTR